MTVMEICSASLQCVLLFKQVDPWLLLATSIPCCTCIAIGQLFMIALDMIFEKRTERREERAEAMSEADESIPGTHDDISVFPMAIPMLAGPGAIASVGAIAAEATGSP